jgi:hypothetical protein
MSAFVPAVASARRLHQLEPVTERVVDVDPLKPIEALVVDDLEPAPPALGDDGRDVVHEEADVRLTRGPEVLLDTEVHTYVPTLEPRAATLREVRMPRDLGQAEHPAVERARIVFLTLPWHLFSENER